MQGRLQPPVDADQRTVPALRVKAAETAPTHRPPHLDLRHALPRLAPDLALYRIGDEALLVRPVMELVQLGPGRPQC